MIECLGFTVASGYFFGPDKLLYASAAPGAGLIGEVRENFHLDDKIIFGNNWKMIEIIQKIIFIDKSNN